MLLGAVWPEGNRCSLGSPEPTKMHLPKSRCQIGASIVHLGGQGAHRHIDLSRFLGPGEAMRYKIFKG
jgi:hypothetical protein